MDFGILSFSWLYVFLVVVWALFSEWSLEERQFQGFPLAVYTNAKGSPLRIRPHLETAKFYPNSAQRAPFLPCAGPVKRGPCRPSTSRAAAAAPPPTPAHALQHTLGVARGAVPHSVAGSLAHTPEQPWPSHWLLCSQVHERATSEKWHRRTRMSARCTPATPPALAAWPTPLMPMRRTSPMLRTVVPAGRCGRGAAERRDGRVFDD